jgi:hypothetical protein
MKEKICIGIIAVLLLAIIIIGYHAAVSNPPQKPLNIESTTSLDSGDVVIASFGNQNRTTGINNMHTSSYYPDNFTAVIRNDMEPYAYPKGPIIGYGYDMSGAIVVLYYQEWPVNQTLINTIYSHISSKGKDYGFESIPCRFISVDRLEQRGANDTLSQDSTRTRR